MNEWVNGVRYEWTDGWMNKCMIEEINELTKKMNEWMNEWNIYLKLMM